MIDIKASLYSLEIESQVQAIFSGIYSFANWFLFDEELIDQCHLKILFFFYFDNV